MVDTYWGLFWGYSCIWLLVVVFLVINHKRVTRLEQQISMLSRGNLETAGKKQEQHET